MAHARGSGMIGKPGGAFNAHNQGVARKRYQGSAGSGFAIEFLGPKDMRIFEAALEDGAIRIQRTAVEAAIRTGDEVKQKLRTYLDGVFRGSAPTANNHRRATNAMVQSATYPTVKGEPGFAYTIYSKLGRGAGPSSFIDYLLLHLHGATVSPRTWFRIAVSPDAKALQRRGGRFTTGSFPEARTKVFTRPAKDDPGKLFLLRQTRTGKTQLLEVLLKSVTIKPKLGGMEVIFREADAIFDRNADAAWAQSAGADGTA